MDIEIWSQYTENWKEQEESNKQLEIVEKEFQKYLQNEFLENRKLSRELLDTYK